MLLTFICSNPLDLEKRYSFRISLIVDSKEEKGRGEAPTPKAAACFVVKENSRS